MSAPLINRSLTTIRTELEFLHDSEVIEEELYQRLLLALPHKYIKDMPPWGVDKLDLSDGTEEVTEKFSRASMAPAYEEKVSVYAAPVETPMAPPSVPPANPAHKPIGYCKALFDYNSNEAGDLNMFKDDKIAVVEHMSEDWWKGYKQGSEKPGVFPSIMSMSYLNKSLKVHLSTVRLKRFLNLTMHRATPRHLNLLRLSKDTSLNNKDTSQTTNLIMMATPNIHLLQQTIIKPLHSNKSSLFSLLILPKNSLKKIHISKSLVASLGMLQFLVLVPHLVVIS